MKLRRFIYCNGSTTLSLSLAFFSVSLSYARAVGPWTGDQPIARPLPTYKTTQTLNKIQISMSLVGFEPMNPVSDRVTVRPLWWADVTLLHMLLSSPAIFRAGKILDADLGDRVVQDMNCLHPLEPWDREFESGSRHRRLCVFILCSFCAVCRPCDGLILLSRSPTDCA
jgi:hypothetical protein